MAIFNVKHGEGTPGSVVVNDTPTLVAAGDRLRQWFFIRNNPSGVAPTDRIFLAFTSDPVAAGFVFGTGVLLDPGEFYEINDLDLYLGPIWAIADAGSSVTLFIHSAR
jgi:hypothetical protein